MSAESAAERICGLVEVYFARRLHLGKEAEIAQIIREETRCDRLAEALEKCLTAGTGLMADYWNIFKNHKSEKRADKWHKVVADARALLAEIEEGKA